MLFIALVPHRQVENNTREEPSFRDSEEKARRQPPLVFLHHAVQRGDYTPDKSKRR